MAFLIAGLGVLGQIAGQLGSHHKHGIDPSAQAANPYGPTFGNVLAGQLDALGASDPLAQLTTIVQNGTPISTVVDRLAHQVAARTGKSLKATISALSPPSKAPPGTAAQEVAALARRLQTMLASARGADQRVGQKSDTSGQILDATSAKEIPAQTNDPESSSSQLDVSALAKSLLAEVAASFGPAQSASGNATPLASSPAHSAVTNFSERAKASTQAVSTLARVRAALASDQSPAGDPNAAVPSPGQAVAQNAPPQTPDANGAPSVASFPSAGTQPVDLLARMLARAANVDARVNGSAVATALATRSANVHAAATSHLSGSASSNGTAGQTGGNGRLDAVISEIVASQTGNDASPDQDGGSRNPSASGNAPSAGPVSTTSAPTGIAAFAVSVASPSSNAHASSSPAFASPNAQVDPSAIAEQVVKSMSMRTMSDGTSAVRIRLVPEQLGSVTMHLTVDGSNVSATAVTQNVDVRNALMAHQHQLSRSLADAGLKLTGFTVNLSGGDTGNDRNRDRTSGFGRHYTVHEVAGSGQTDSAESASAGPSIAPESTLALFNYLA